MKLRAASYWVPVICWFVAGCAAVKEDNAAVGTTGAVESVGSRDMYEDSDGDISEAVPSEKSRLCTLPASDVEKLRANAKDYLLKEWPVLDSQCERMSPLRKPPCDQPSHFGYAISFNVETLEPTRIGWLTEKSIE